MRLAVFTNQFPSRAGTFFARDMRGLIHAGIDIDVFAIYPLDPTLWCYVPEILNEQFLPRNKVHHISLTESFRTAKFRPLRKLSRFVRDIVSISASAITSGIEPLVKTNYVFPKAWNWSQKYGTTYDHILAYWGNYTATCAYLFRRLLPSSIPFSIFLHAGIDLYLNQIFLREKLLAATNIITCSDFNHSFIKQNFEDIWTVLSPKVYVHYHGLDFENFSFTPGHRPPRKVLAVGNLNRWKGFDYLLRAIAELIQRGFDCELELVGGGKDADSLNRLAATLRIADRVNFRGWVKPEVIPAIMSQATVLVHPSSELGDGVPNVVKEAMAVGTPVIGSDISGIPELLREGKLGVLVPPKDVKALADAIQNLLTNGAVREEYAASARRYAMEKFDLWRNGQCFAHVLRSAN